MYRLIAVISIPFALLICGVSFLWLGATKGNWLPDLVPKEKVEKNMPKLTIFTFTHWLANLAVEWVRFDAQWWTKFLAFVVIIESMTIIYVNL